jgi:hydroxymethylbilane synthase
VSIKRTLGRRSRPIRLGTRGSALALAQAESVARAIEAGDDGLEAELVPITTSGDRRIGLDKSRFVKEIELALLSEEIDLAVHSAKDVPGTLPAGLAIVGVPPAEDPRDALVGASSLEDLPEQARVGTSSLRRRSQLLAIRPDLELAELHGNVDTRLSKLAEGRYDAIVIALAGLRRLGREGETGTAFDVEQLVPAPGQGVLALEARADDAAVTALAARLSDGAALTRLESERVVVAVLDTSCRTPVGVHARRDGDTLLLDAYVGLPDGTDWIRDELSGDVADPSALGKALAKRMLSVGAGELLRRAEEQMAAADAER